MSAQDDTQDYPNPAPVKEGAKWSRGRAAFALIMLFWALQTVLIILNNPRIQALQTRDGIELGAMGASLLACGFSAGVWLGRRKARGK
jgi:hypothetical protein